ncbi:MAG TPA: LPS assembly protein LptD [Terriglobales bacterium]|nr:LPS assembly protein LptD [Terriglobales bacterium]
MFRRNRFGITAAFICHLLLAPSVVTSQLLPAAQPGSAPASPPPQASPTLPPSRAREEVIIQAREQEKSGDVYKLRGDVEVNYRKLVLRADEATYDDATGEVAASGHLTLDGGPHDEHIVASHGRYNVRTETGTFYDVIGTSGVRFHGRNVVLTSTNPFTFTGKVVDKVAPEVYVVHHGTVTSCELPRPKWTLNGERIVVDLGGKARAYNSTFRVEKVPVFYLPYADQPVEQLGRQSGFLLPNTGTSSSKGFILGDGYYWAIDRSMDATLGAEYYSSRGWAQHGSWRFRPSEDSYLSARYFGVLDRGFGPEHVDQGGEDAGIDGQAKFPYGFRGVLSAEYLSSYLFRLAWEQTFTQAVDSEVKSLAFLSKNLDGFGFNFLASRYQNFQSTMPGDVVTILHVPSFEVSSVDRRIGRTPVYWSFDSAVEGVSRKEPGFLTNDLVGRFDVNPRASLPLLLDGWTLRPEIGLRETYYTQRLMPNGGLGVPIQEDVNRNAAEASFELRPPSLVRIFDRPVFRHKLKHTIEPRLVYRFVGGVDNFADIIRFDSRDILSDTNELEYAVVQRLYIKPAGKPRCGEQAPAAGAAVAATSNAAPAGGTADSCGARGARELVSWELKQKYFFDPDFGGAVTNNNKRNVLTTTDQFTGIAFLTSPRRFTPIVSRILVHPSNQTEFGWQLDYDTVASRVNGSTVFANYRLGNFFLGGTHTYFHDFFSNPTPGPERFNQFRVTLGYGNLSKRGINAATTIGFDANFHFLQYAAVQTSYNWDCCGVSFEYRRYALGSVRNENQFRFAFTLANIGAFGNLKRQERIY